MNLAVHDNWTEFGVGALQYSLDKLAESDDEKNWHLSLLNKAQAAIKNELIDAPRISACQPEHLNALALPPAILPWSEVLVLLPSFWQWVTQRVERRHRVGRLKQWLNLLRRRYPEAQAAFDALRLSNDGRMVEAWLHAHAPTKTIDNL